MRTDSGGAYPSGDPFIVCPKEDGTAEESLRMMTLNEAMNDLRALNYLAELTGREKVLEMIEEDLKEPLAFDVYPKHPDAADYLIRLRKKVNQALCENIYFLFGEYDISLVILFSFLESSLYYFHQIYGKIMYDRVIADIMERCKYTWKEKNTALEQ